MVQHVYYGPPSIILVDYHGISGADWHGVLCPKGFGGWEATMSLDILVYGVGII